MKLWFDLYRGYGEACQTVVRELVRRAPARFEPVHDWRQAELTIDLLVDSPIGSLSNRARDKDAPHWDWHHELLQRITGPQRKALFFICCFEGSEVLRYAAREARVSFSFLPDFPTRLGLPGVRWRLQPLGVDPAVFSSDGSDRSDRSDWSKRPYDVYTWGYVADTEGIDAVSVACARSGRRMLHSGQDFRFTGAHYQFVPPARTPAEVADRYRSARFANAMRRPYGFELAAIEAPLCGARPICLNLPCYTHWFRDLPCYVTPGPDMAAGIARCLAEERPVTVAESVFVRETFNWDRVARQFWAAIEEAL